MNADAFRHLYDYHFAENRKIWENFVEPMAQNKFVLACDYSMGSLRNQIIHLINVDEAWFSDLSSAEFPEGLSMEESSKEAIRAYWDKVETMMRTYLDKLRDEMLFDKPLRGEDKDLRLWQVLLHVVNHGTDHRAQILRLINDLGIKTGPQDYIFYTYEHLT